MRHLLRRIGFYIIALWAAVTLNFVLPRLAPGDPAQVFLARFRGRINPSAIHALEIEFGVSHDPIWTQYFQYLNNLFHGNMGLSISYFPTPVSTVIWQEMPWTLVLSGVSVLLSFLLGTFIGIISAWKHGSLFDTIFSPVMNLLSAIPYFWFALIVLYLFAFLLRWLPLGGGYDLAIPMGWSFDFVWSAIVHSILPAITIVVSSIAGWLLGMRNAMITTLSEDYVLMAEAKGLSERRVMYSYAARNAILPNISGFALALGFVVSGQLLTEVVFSYPGVGYVLLQAVQNADYALLQGIFLIIAVAVLGANFLADMLYIALDPRARQERSE